MGIAEAAAAIKIRRADSAGALRPITARLRQGDIMRPGRRILIIDDDAALRQSLA
jgi:hypothetical protein